MILFARSVALAKRTLKNSPDAMDFSDFCPLLTERRPPVRKGSLLLSDYLLAGLKNIILIYDKIKKLKEKD